MEVTFCQHDFRCNVQRHHFVYFYEVIMSYYPNFKGCFYFRIALFRSSSSHCQLMNLFKNKKSFKEKVDSDNNWKTRWFLRVIYFLKLSSRFIRKKITFFWKTSNFLTKICLLTFCIFCLIKEVLNHQLYLRKYVENIFDILSQKKTKHKTRGAKIWPNFINQYF